MGKHCIILSTLLWKISRNVVLMKIKSDSLHGSKGKNSKMLCKTKKYTIVNVTRKPTNPEYGTFYRITGLFKNKCV